MCIRDSYESLRIGFRSLSVSAHYAAEAVEAAEISAGDDGSEDSPTRSVSAPIAVGSSDAHVGSSSTSDSPGSSIQQDQPDSASSRVVHLAETDTAGSDANPDSISNWQIAIAFIVAFGFSIALFKVAPVLLTQWVGVGGKSFSFVAVESSIRIGIFIGYLALVGLMPDMRRVFQFHSAEHKAINAWERGIPLDPEAVNEQSRIHVRCGTAFMLWVFVVAIAVFGLYGYWFQPDRAELIISRIVLLPVIAGLSFELIRFAGKYPTNPILRGVLAPGLWLQYLTTRPCTPDQCEVAVAALKAVLRREYPEASIDEARDALSGDDEPARIMA